MKRTLLIIAGVAVVLLGVGAWWLWGRTPDKVSLVLVQQLNQPRVVEALTLELREFQSLHKGLEVRLAESGTSDLAILSNYPANPDEWAFPLTPWSGTLWVLGARADKLDSLKADLPDEVAALRAGTLSPGAFEKLIAAAKAEGPAPLTLGNSHLWPYALWFQAWAAATLGPDGAVHLPAAGDAATAPVREALARWRAAGWFDEKAWPLGWAQGLQPLGSTATFALLSEPQLSALPPATRSKLEFFPLPHRAEDPAWSLGDAQFLASSKATAHPQEAEELIRFLTSPGVTSRLATATGRPFFAWTATGAAPVVLADWTSRANEPEFRALAEALAK